MSSLRISDHLPEAVARPLHILLVSDAWTPQVNGVVRSIGKVKAELEARGHQVEMITPDQFIRVPCPTYPEIALAFGSSFRIRKRIRLRDYDAVHIATEGPLGFAARRACLKEGVPFSTAVHTKFPEYIEARFRIPLRYTDPIQKWFHREAQAVMVATKGFAEELQTKGFQHLKIWSRGVDTALFHPARRQRKAFDQEPLFLYVGRVAVEKNIQAFLDLKLPGRKKVVGDGPQRLELARLYPEVEFAGFQEGKELARSYADADVFVFPSLTDTFGNVLLEALSSGTPVAAFPVRGPLDILGRGGPGVLSEDLEVASVAALQISRSECRNFALQFSWEKSADQFLSNLALLR